MKFGTKMQTIAKYQEKVEKRLKDYHEIGQIIKKKCYIFINSSKLSTPRSFQYQ